MQRRSARTEMRRGHLPKINVWGESHDIEIMTVFMQLYRHPSRTILNVIDAIFHSVSALIKEKISTPQCS